MPTASPSAASAALRAVREPSEVASPSVVQLRRRLAISPRQAFELWRDGDTVGSWFLPRDNAAWIDRPTMVPQIGGALALRVSVGADWFHIHGTVIAADPGAGLELEWNWESSSPILGSGSGTTVRVRFVPAREAVDVVITHDGLPCEAVRDAYIRGWRRCLDGMHRLIESSSVVDGP